MELNTISRPYFKALAANANTSSFAAKPSTTTEPTNDGVINLAAGIVPIKMVVLPYGLGANNDAFSVRILAWRHIAGTGLPGQLPLWLPVILVEVACVMGNFTGVANSPVLNTEFFCDTITPVAARLPDRVIAAGTAVNSDVAIVSPTNDTPGWFEFPLKGFEKVEFQFDQTTNTPTMNCLCSYW